MIDNRDADNIFGSCQNGLRCADLETIRTWITQPVGALNYNLAPAYLSKGLGTEIKLQAANDTPSIKLSSTTLASTQATLLPSMR
jgi:hypothetical protein